MIIRFVLLTCAGLGLLASAASAENEAPRSTSGNELSAQVTIPYQEFKRLVDAASAAVKPEDSPDIAGVVTRAQIKLSLDPQHPSGQAEFDINTFGHKWVFVPLRWPGLAHHQCRLRKWYHRSTGWTPLSINEPAGAI